MESDSRARLDLDRSSLAVKLNGLSTITSHPSAEECGTMHHSHTFPSYMLSTSMPVFPLFTLIISLSHHVNQKIAVGKVNATYLYLDFSEILSGLVLFPFAQLWRWPNLEKFSPLIGITLIIWSLSCKSRYSHVKSFPYMSARCFTSQKQRKDGHSCTGGRKLRSGIQGFSEGHL